MSMMTTARPPRSIRNFWLEGEIFEHDAQRDLPGTGPRGADGGFTLRVLAREHGTVTQALRIEGIAEADGTVRVLVFGPDTLQGEIVTTR